MKTPKEQILVIISNKIQARNRIVGQIRSLRAEATSDSLDGAIATVSAFVEKTNAPWYDLYAEIERIGQVKAR